MSKRHLFVKDPNENILEIKTLHCKCRLMASDYKSIASS